MGFYLLDHPNPNASKHPDGRYYGQPGMLGRPRGIVVHTAEGQLDLDPPDLSAEAVARYFASTTRSASAHVVTDSDSTIELLPDTHRAIHTIDGWRDMLGVEIAYRAAQWGKYPDHEWQLIRRAAAWCREKCIKFQIPPVQITRGDYKAGQRGIVAHGWPDGLDQRFVGGKPRRTDPGANFPWAQFLKLVAVGEGTVWDKPGDPITDRSTRADCLAVARYQGGEPAVKLMGDLEIEGARAFAYELNLEMLLDLRLRRLE